MSNKCKFCNKELKSEKILKAHQTTAKYCLLKQKGNDTIKTDFICEGCEVLFSSKQNLSLHKERCESIKFRIQINELKISYENELENLKKHNTMLETTLKFIDKKDVEHQKQIDIYKEQLEKKQIEYEKQLEKKDEQIRELQDKMERITTTAISRPTTVQTNTINNKYSYLSPLSLTSDEIKNRVETQVNPYTLCED